MTKSILHGATVVLTLSVSGQAADINVYPWGQLQALSIEGEIGANDFEVFKLKATSLVGRVVVFPRGPGGNLIAALQIGEFIRLKGWGTFVYGECESACAAIWLAGVPRMMMFNARIGFHAASINGQEKGNGNALFGAYMTRLGLGYEAVSWATSASPTEIAYLTPTKAKELGIDVNVIEDQDKQANAQPTAPPSPQAAQVGVYTTTLTDLHLRSAPNPRAPDVLGPPPNDYIPRGSQVVITGQCQYGDNVWCPVSWGDYRGWVNAYFLANADGRRVACVMSTSALGCGPPDQTAQSQLPTLPQASAQKKCGPGPRLQVAGCYLSGYGPLYCLEFRRQLEAADGCQW